MAVCPPQAPKQDLPVVLRLPEGRCRHKAVIVCSSSLDGSQYIRKSFKLLYSFPKHIQSIRMSIFIDKTLIETQ